MKNTRDPLRARKLVVGLISLALVAAPFTRLPALAQKGECNEFNDASGPWVSLDAPAFKAGGSALTGFALDSMFATSFFLATNGTEVWEGPCNWRKSFTAADGQSIVDVEIPRASAGHAVMALDQTNALGIHEPHVMTTGDGGETWTAGDVGLSPTGRPVLVRSAPRDPRIFYLVIELQQGAQVLYTTADAGASWQPKSQDLTSLVGRSVSSLEVDPLDANDIWTAGETGLYHSTDGGSNFTAVPEFAGTPSGPIDIFHGPGEPARLLVFRPTESGMMSSDDGGGHWTVVHTPGAAQSVAHGAVSEAVLASFAGKIYAYSPDVIGWNLVTTPKPSIVDLTAETVPLPSFFGRTGTTIELYRGVIGGDLEDPEEVVDIPDISITEGGTEALPDPTLSASARRVRIKPGKTATVAYDLNLSTARTPIDVFFLVDSSSTMKNFLTELVESLAATANGLTAKKLDVNFGVGEYRAYPAAFPPRSPIDEPNFVYHLLQQIGPPGTGLRDALKSLDADGGGEWTATLGALYQMATGAGQDVFPPGPSDHDVPENLDAEFRKNALRVVVVATNDYYYDADGEDLEPDIPDFDVVAGELTALNIRQVAIHLSYRGVFWGEEDSKRMAKDTGALAPDSGVDCDGDGVSEVPAGAPLVCQVEPTEEFFQSNALVPALVNLVDAVRSRADMGLTAHGNQRFVQKVTPSSGYPGSALNANDRFRFEVTYRCPLNAGGEFADFKLDATRDDSLLDSTTTKVVCVEPKEPPSVASVPIDRVLALIPLLPAPPPPPLPNLATSAQAQSQAQAQAHAAFAAQEEEQPQTAFVHALHAQREQMAEEYSMSSYEDRTRPLVPPGLFVASAGMLMAAAFGVSMSLRERIRPRRARR